MADSKAKEFVGIAIFAFVIYGLYQAGVIQISGLNAFQTGFTLQPIMSLGNQAVEWLHTITGISTVAIVIVIMAVVLYSAASKWWS